MRKRTKLLPSTRREAISKGIRWYLTGKPCVHDHIAVRTTYAGDCTDCAKARGKRNRQLVLAALHRGDEA